MSERPRGATSHQGRRRKTSGANEKSRHAQRTRRRPHAQRKRGRGSTIGIADPGPERGAHRRNRERTAPEQEGRGRHVEAPQARHRAPHVHAQDQAVRDRRATQRRALAPRSNGERTTTHGARRRGETVPQGDSAENKRPSPRREETLHRTRTPRAASSESLPPIAATAHATRARRRAGSRRRRAASAGPESQGSACTPRSQSGPRRHEQEASRQGRRR